MYVPDREAYGTKAPSIVAFKFIKSKLRVSRFPELEKFQQFDKTHFIAKLDCSHFVMRRIKKGLTTTICPRCYEMWKDDRYKYGKFLKDHVDTFEWKDDPLRKINERNTPK